METEKLREFQEFATWVDGLNKLDDATWTKPLAPGKWGIQGIVSHIYLWDKYFLENAIEKIVKHEAITTQDLDYDEFNADAAKYGKTQSKADLIAQTIDCRNHIARHLRQLSDADFNKEYQAPTSKFTIPEYLADFVWHDNHHKAQIAAFIKDKE